MIVRGLSFLWRKDRFSYLALVVTLMSVLVFNGSDICIGLHFSPVVVDYSRLSGNYDLPMPFVFCCSEPLAVDTRTPGGYNAPLISRGFAYTGV